MTTLIEKARAATYAHHHVEMDQKAAKEAAWKLKREQELADAEVWAAKEMPMVSEGILNSSNRGLDKFEYTIAQWEDRRSSAQTGDRARALSKLIGSEGFKVMEYFNVEEPCGSDSYFPNRVVTTSLIIGW